MPREWNKRKGSSLSLRFQSFLPPVIIVTDSQTDTGGRPFIYGNYCFGLVTQVNQVLNGSSTGPYGSLLIPKDPNGSSTGPQQDLTRVVLKGFSVLLLIFKLPLAIGFWVVDNRYCGLDFWIKPMIRVLEKQFNLKGWLWLAQMFSDKTNQSYRNCVTPSMCESCNVTPESLPAIKSQVQIKTQNILKRRDLTIIIRMSRLDNVESRKIWAVIINCILLISRWFGLVFMWSL